MHVYLINSINLKKSFSILFVFTFLLISFRFTNEKTSWQALSEGITVYLSPYDFLSLSRHEKKVTNISHDVVNEVFYSDRFEYDFMSSVMENCDFRPALLKPQKFVRWSLCLIWFLFS